MNRRNVISIFALALMVPATLIARPPKNKPESPSCKDCKKCGRACKCDCKKGCKCKPGCCKAERPSPPRGFDGRTPNFQPPHSKPTRGFDGRTPSFGPPSRGRPSSDNRSPDRISRYKEMINKFDKNEDGKLDEKEREALKKYIQKRRS